MNFENLYEIKIKVNLIYKILLIDFRCLLEQRYELTILIYKIFFGIQNAQIYSFKTKGFWKKVDIS